ncbi:unnamed protein product [Euphydryas editha]|uniref:Rab3 GTPase-activating protein regulatory subunit n=1 Tax=Euphydryas editha TaxID=104508 RepID=A0AAU9VAD6_EUPED|nr:unnamed protein product [Euphydryas editha]
MCSIEQIADCGDISTLGRALFIPEREDETWLSKCSVSLSSCGGLLAVGYKKRLCLLSGQWISSTDSNTYLISWSGTLPSEVTALLSLSICSSQHSSQGGPDWFCIVVGFLNGSVGFYTNTGHLLLLEKLEDKHVCKISCHTGTYGTFPDDVHIHFESAVYVVAGSSLFQTLRNAKAQLAKVQAGLQSEYSIDSRNIQIRKWIFSEQDQINDAAVAGLYLTNSYEHYLAASTYGGYDAWYRSVPSVRTLVLASGISPYIGFHYALEGGNAPPIQDVARAVANKIKSALPGWLGGSTESAPSNTEPLIRTEQLSMHNGLYDTQRHGTLVAISQDRRLAAFADNLGRVAVLDITKGYIIRLFKGCRDAQCAFVQIFDADSKKPQQSIVKEFRRAIFLIIYNPKKGLIDIRLMQRGTRVAVFTATKNGKLLYNTCGLVGAEKNYTHRKSNLPEFQCVLIDPDGKLKEFNIPFYYCLEGEHMERSKDLHVLKIIRDIVKKTTNFTEDVKTDIIENADKLKTLEIKKHCLEILIKSSELSSELVFTCLERFWDSFPNDDIISEQNKTFKNYFANLALVTLFYRRICNEDVKDIQNLIDKVYNDFNIKEQLDNLTDVQDDENEDPDFHLLEDDNCILERLLILAQDEDLKDHHQAKVTFADNRTSTYKDFISCFELEQRNEYISLKKSICAEKVSNLSSNVFKSIINLNDYSTLKNLVRNCKIDPKEIVKLVITHVMNMSLEQINIDLIEKIISVFYYICSATEEATNVMYNEISPWWENIRLMLVDLPCPLRTMIVAMACKAVVKIFESKSSDKEDWESVTKENAKWGILIGKLEDISILSIALMFKADYKGESLPKLPFEGININLKYIYTRGKGSVTELIAKWLCSMGTHAFAIEINELMEKTDETQNSDSSSSTGEGNVDVLKVENHRELVDNNPQIFKWLSLLRRQFPLSTAANYIIANMSWEYAMAWQKCMNKSEHLKAVVQCLKKLPDMHLRLGMFFIIWSTYLKHVFQSCCRLVNNVGKLPKDHLCLQDLGFNSETLLGFLENCTDYLEEFYNCSIMCVDEEIQSIQYEKIWDESLPSLVEVAQEKRNVNSEIIKLNYQMSCTISYQCHLKIKFTKPLDSLYDVDYQYALEALNGNVVQQDITSKCSEKFMNPRMKYLTRLIRKAIDTISVADNDEGPPSYYTKECSLWIRKIWALSELWDMGETFVWRTYIVGLYHMGYDRLALDILNQISDAELILSPIIAITIQRLKRHLQSSKNQAEIIVSMPPQLYRRIQNTDLDTSVPANPSLSTTKAVLQKMLNIIIYKSSVDEDGLPEVKLAQLIFETCEYLVKREL